MVPIALKVGELYATMRVDDGQFNSGLDRAKGRFEGLRSAVGTGVKTMATAFAATTTAVAGIGAAALRVGLDYNRMQQSSRAALSTLLGSAEAANAQMDKLDEFARSSPFAKQVFIQAQQQLIGFGMAADDVLPTLNAIQNAVAAVGGSNDDISEITRILATVTSSGKITAETLNQLGVRGVDAATLIGEQMGKTGQEIRDSITNGSLDAGEAVKLLTDGMMARFGGATANIKQQMDGAADRVKGAFRDIGSALAAPFIDPKGGGYLVEWTNKVADAMRAAEAKIRPLVDLLVIRFGPGLASVTPLLDQVRGAINSWDISKVNGQLDEMGKYTPVIAGVAAAMFSLGTQSVPIVGAISPLVAGFAALAATSPEVRRVFSDLGSELQPLVPQMGALTVELADLAMLAIRELVPAFGELLVSGGHLAVTLGGPLIGAVTGLVRAGEPLVSLLADVVGWVADLPTPVLATAAAFLALQGPLKPVATGIQNVIEAMMRVSEMRAVQQTLATAGTEVTNLDVAAMRAKPSLDRLGASIRGAFVINAPALAITGVVSALAYFVTRNQEAARASEELGRTLDQTTGAITEQTEALVYRNLEKQIQQYRDLGGAAKDYWDAALGDAAAMERVNAVLNEHSQVLQEAHGEERVYTREARGLKDALDAQRTALSAEQEAHRRKAEVTRRGAGADRDAADAADEHRRAQEQLRAELEEGIDASLSAAEAKLRVEDAAARAAEALDRKREAEEHLAEVNASSTATEEDRTEATRAAEQAGRDAERAILDQVRATENHIAAIGRNNGSYREMRSEMAAARESFIQQQISMGATRAEAAKLADQYGLIPSRVDTFVHLSGVQEALNKIGNLDHTLNRINGKTVTASVVVRQYGQAAVATGGYMSDIAAFSDGGYTRRRGLLTGPGGPKDDLIRAMVSNREFIMQASAVEREGVPAMYALNSGAARIVPRYADGGEPRPYALTAYSQQPTYQPASPSTFTPASPSTARIHPDDMRQMAMLIAQQAREGVREGAAQGFQGEIQDALLAQEARVW